MTLTEFIADELRRKKPRDMTAAGTQIQRLLARALKNRWRISFRDCGLGHGDFGVSVRLDKTDVLIVGDIPFRNVAEHICEAHNAGQR